MHLPDITGKDTWNCYLPNGVVWMLQPKFKELVNYYAESQALFIIDEAAPTPPFCNLLS